MTKLTGRVPLLAVLMVAACAAPQPPREAGIGAGTLYTFVVLSADGAPIARAITSAATCPPIELDGVAHAMTVRALSGLATDGSVETALPLAHLDDIPAIAAMMQRSAIPVADVLAKSPIET